MSRLKCFGGVLISLVAALPVFSVDLFSLYDILCRSDRKVCIVLLFFNSFIDVILLFCKPLWGGGGDFFPHCLQCGVVV